MIRLNRMWTSHRQRGAVVLAISLTLTLISAIGALLMTRTLLDQKRINERRRNLWRAYLHAEAGIATIQHWGAYPNEFDPDTSFFDEQIPGGLTNAQLLLVEDETRYPVIAALGPGGLHISETDFAASSNPDPFASLVTESGWGVGRLTDIYIFPIDNVNDAITDGPDLDLNLVSTNPDDDNYAFFKVICRGVGENDLVRELRAFMKPTPLALIALPAPVISLASASAFGNAKVHWGEAWSKTNFSVLNRTNMTYAQSDPFAKWRTEGLFEFPSNWQTNSTYQANKLYAAVAPSGGGDFTLPASDQPGLFPVTNNGDWKDIFYQNVPSGTLDWPDLASQYEVFKDLAKANNRYYTTDSSGNIYHNGTIVDFYQAFSPNDPDTPFELAFVDTLDGNPPASDGSNLATIHISGDNDVGDRIRGFYYFAANFRVSGVGSPADLTVESPITSTDVTLQKMWLDGVIYSSGTMDMDGNAGIYGAVVAENGFVGGGTPDVYYNEDLADGLELDNGNLGGPFRVVMQTNYSP